jgi:hypothetical protein
MHQKQQCAARAEDLVSFEAQGATKKQKVTQRIRDPALPENHRLQSLLPVNSSLRWISSIKAIEMAASCFRRSPTRARSHHKHDEEIAFVRTLS